MEYSFNTNTDTVFEKLIQTSQVRKIHLPVPQRAEMTHYVSFGAEEKKLKIDGDNSSSLLMTCSPHTVIGWWYEKTNIPINYAQVWLDSAGGASKESSKELDFPWPGKTFVGGGDGEQISI